MSDTPRVDAQETKFAFTDVACADPALAPSAHIVAVVPALLARQLERELSEARSLVSAGHDTRLELSLDLRKVRADYYECAKRLSISVESAGELGDILHSLIGHAVFMNDCAYCQKLKQRALDALSKNSNPSGQLAAEPSPAKAGPDPGITSEDSGLEGLGPQYAAEQAAFVDWWAKEGPIGGVEPRAAAFAAWRARAKAVNGAGA